MSSDSQFQVQQPQAISGFDELDFNVDLGQGLRNQSRFGELRRFEEALICRKALEHPTTGLHGRILRGKNEDDFQTLTEDPARKVVFLMGDDGLSSLPGMSGYEMLIQVGHSIPDIYKNLVEKGKSYKLVVFTSEVQPMAADWDGVLSIVQAVYPEHFDAVAQHVKALSQISLEEVERIAELKFSDFSEEHPLFMTSARFSESDKNLWQTRAFLYHSLQMRAQFKGDGFTYRNDGAIGVREYLIPNMPLASMENFRLFDLEVEFPIGN